ncbi:hypothetical protein ACFL6X_05480 [Candidatus Latescibacterota bacterium]
MFVWILHRTSGLALIVLLGLKVLTGFFMMTKGERPDWAIALHANPLADIPLIILLVFHALYGVRTVVYELGLRRERALFWSATILAAVLSLALIALYLTRDY